MRTNNIKDLSLPELKKKVWKVFSSYIRQKYADEYGYDTCYTCGVRKPWKEMQCGHGFGGRNNSILFDEELVRPQCRQCNIFKGGNYDIFHTKLIEENGIEWFKRKVKQKHEIKKFTHQELEDKYNYYKHKLITIKNMSLTDELKTLCDEKTEPQAKVTQFSKLKVTVLDSTYNPYHSMFEMALQTWGNPNKWAKASPELRFKVVKDVLDKKALPLALEVPYFVFQVNNVSRAAFDQIARSRIGTVYAARGFKDNDLNYTKFILPLHKLKKETTNSIREWYKVTKLLYNKIQQEAPNWVARSVIPMYTSYNFIMGIRFDALQRFCGNRMQTTEMPDTVAVAWLMRQAIKPQFPLLAEYLRPWCDWAHKDLTVAVNGFANELGVIHASDNRWPGFENFKGDVRYKEPCTDLNAVAHALNITIPGPKDWVDYTFDTLKAVDRARFTK